jgi:site-specific recombinase XerD
MNNSEKSMFHTFSIRFFIRRSRSISSSDNIIYCCLNYAGQRIEITTEFRIDADKWDSQLKKVKGNSSTSRLINNTLEEIRNKYFSIYSKLKLEGTPFNVFTIRDEYLGLNKTKSSITIIELVDKHNLYKESLIGIDVSKATIERYNTLKRHLIGFMKYKFQEADLPLEQFNYPILLDFESYLKIKLKIGHNTAVKYIRNLRTVINYGIQIDILDKDPFLKYKTKIKEVRRGFLEKHEIELIKNLNIEIDRLAVVRDIFIFCCYTGLAYIDVKQLTMNNITIGIDGEPWINTERKKTSNVVKVPILPPAMELIKSYKDHPARIYENRVLPVLSNQKMNAYLKEIGDLAGINKRISMHLARHTFATTITLQGGASIETVSKMLGHSNIGTTQIYAKITDQKVSQEMQKLRQQLEKQNEDSSEVPDTVKRNII